MSALSKHLSLIVPLIGLLFSLQSIVIFQRIIASREEVVARQYSIGITTKDKLDIRIIKDRIPEAKELKQLNTKELLAQLTKDIRDKSIFNMKQLSFFYSLNLEHFPDTGRLNEIKRELEEIPSVVSINTFSKRHLEKHTLISFMRLSVTVLSSLLLTVSFILMLKQIEVWRYENKEMMEIMDIHGAGMWIRNGSLFKLALTDSLIASCIMSALTFYISELELASELAKSMDINREVFQVSSDFVRMFAFSVAMSFSSAIFVILTKARV